MKIGLFGDDRRFGQRLKWLLRTGIPCVLAAIVFGLACLEYPLVPAPIQIGFLALSQRTALPQLFHRCASQNNCEP